MPHLKALSQRGPRIRLTTGYGGKSPVIWTTIATGVVPERHGITDFVVPTERGDVPVSSSVRKVPALWNILTASERRVAVVGWWATWPAEEISGVVLSDRTTIYDDEVFSPPEWQADFERLAAEARRRPTSSRPTPTESATSSSFEPARNLCGRTTTS